MQNKKVLTVRYPKRANLQEHFVRHGARGVLFVETGRRLELAEHVVLLVEFPAEHRSFRLRGKVISRRRGGPDSPLAPGVEIEFPSEENRTLQLVLDHAAGKTVDFVVRRSRRLACSFVVSYGRDTEFVREFAEDIGEGGTFIRTDTIFPVGTIVECKLKPPGHLLGIRIAGRVVWVKTSGQPRGMGVEFLFDSERQRKKIRTIVEKLLKLQARLLARNMKAFKQRERFR